MALGMPVVATPSAVEGLLVTHEENIMIAETDNSFSYLIEKVDFR